MCVVKIGRRVRILVLDSPAYNEHDPVSLLTGILILSLLWPKIYH